MNLLTHLLGQSIEEVSEKVALYRQAGRKPGTPGAPCHLDASHLVGESLELVKATVRGPLIEYLRKSADLIKTMPGRSPRSSITESKEKADFSTLPKEEMDAILAHAFDRYFETSGLVRNARKLRESHRKIGCE